MVFSTTGCSSQENAAQMGADSTTDLNTVASLGSWGVDLTHMDATVDPGDDFYRYVNGTWLDAYELPADKASFGSFLELRELSEHRVKAIILELSQTDSAAGSTEQQIGDFYTSFMDEKGVNGKGLDPIQPYLTDLAKIADHAELAEFFGDSVVSYATTPLGIGMGIDRKNPDRYLISLYASGLSMPDRDYYLDESERMVGNQTALRENISKVLQLAGYSQEHASKVSGDVFHLESAIAEIHWPRAERRNLDKTYNPTNLSTLIEDYPNFNFKGMFKVAGLSEIKEINVLHPSAIGPLVDLIVATPIETWRAYLTYQYIVANSGYLDSRTYMATFEFYGTQLNGQKEPRERWKRAIRSISGTNSLGFAIGKTYVEKYFPASAKEEMDRLVENVRATFKERLEELAWMSEETKLEAQAKLAAFHPKIGYPEKTYDFSTLEINPQDLMGNVMRLRQFWHEDDLAKLPNKTDRTEWFMTPQTVNAYYNAQFNEIVFPAAILQAPFFDFKADPAVNYGAIGGVIAHEMGHGFDDQGSKVDATGVQRNWWTEVDRANFVEQTKVLGDQFNTYEPVPGVFVDGSFTMGENIGDLGGVAIALDAYKRSLEGEEAPVIDGFTGVQRFFLSWAQVWRYKSTEEVTLARLKGDPHSPPEFRVNGIVRNIDDWYSAFDVEQDDEMYIKAVDRVSIW